VRSSIGRLCLVVLVALALFQAGAAPARADTLSDYLQNNALLEQLLAQRRAAEAALQQWVAAEQASLAELSAVEDRLHALLGQQAGLVQEQPRLAEAIGAAEAAQAPLAETQARLERRVSAFEVWLAGDAPAPLATNVRGYQDAAAELGALGAAYETAHAQLEALRQRQQETINLLGAANTEIAHWRRQAEALAGQVGTARARALSASAELARIQAQGDELAATVRQQLDALVAAGYPVSVARIAGGPMPVPEPVSWPATAPSYVLPSGRAEARLIAGSPWFVDRQQLAAAGGLDGAQEWTVPVKGIVTTPFGDATPYQAAHYAIDIGTRLYAPVVAAAEGVVEFAGLAAPGNRLASYGLVVMIRHNEHVTTLYAHLDDRAHGLAVQVGDRVQAGQVIGYVGLSGYSTGPHLHFEVRVDNRPVDPLLLVKP
jgi:murein DD-endopeptidase MepM/ murein hydrolase activator NlpD